uniref:C-type lectin domain-containing protein n=1 Tax=Neogobius melanostomus TaxID=47308 RepID=A0A8C6S4U1_9GOBI
VCSLFFMIDLFIYFNLLLTFENNIMNNSVPYSISPNLSKQRGQCGEDWELHGTKCYYFSPLSAKLPWNESRKMCQWLKGDLVKIESREEQVCTR